MKRFSFLLIMVLFLSCCDAEVRRTKNKIENISVVKKEIPEKPIVDFAKTKQKAKEALKYCKQKGLNTKYCILIDMSLHSGVNRFFLWNFKTDTIQLSCVVSHGCCNGPWSFDSSKENPVFSNVPDSHCSSIGKYKLGARGYSDWGINVKYLMHGLEKSNSNALKRYIVFHSWNAIPENEPYPEGAPEGWGCPTISNENMKVIDSIIQKENRKFLMWIYK